MQTLKAITYTRVSGNEQVEHGTSLEGQELICLRKAAEMEAQVVARLCDPGVSGKLYATRTGIQEALRLLESKQANVLIVAKLDRSGRDVDALRDIRKRVELAGAQLVFADGMNFEQNAVGKLMFTQLAGFAEYEREVIRERMMSGKIRRAEQGIQPYRSRPPYGYYIVTNKDKLRGEYAEYPAGTYLIIEEKARWVREMYARIAGGMSLRKTSAWLEAQGVPTARGGKQWGYKTLQVLLSNTTYKGVGSCNRSETLHDERLITERGRKTDEYVRMRPETEWFTFPAPPLVDEATWDVVQARLQENRDKLSGNPRRKFLLTSLVRCPVCGYKMAGANKTDKRRKNGVPVVYQYFICHPKRNGCPERNYPVKQVEQDVAETFRRAAQASGLIEAQLNAHLSTEKQGPSHTDTQELEQMQTELKTLLVRERVAAEAQVNAMMNNRSTEVYDNILADMDSQKARVQARIAALTPTQAIENREAPKDTAERIASVLADVELVLTDTDEENLAERQAVLATIVDKIIPKDGGGVSILLKSQTVYSV